ncbi:hypothetical protein OS493_029611 [Desmophyllum pertusum]|uniref:G-protein coupled receptors family 1 profile domain-containing protein n=1 Tax=Desmophyllum pertusum TaxID=174260 RepID=A0A9X0D7U1_9CNID|nr:hypothetical protein OS493_029611 [Desmophyllum pertusum]
MHESDKTHMNLTGVFALELATRSEAEIVIEFIVVLLVSLIGLSGNFLVLLAIFKTASLRNISNYYVASLSAFELIISVCISIFLPEVVLKGKWTFSDAACQFEGFVTAMLATGSIYAMALIAINRYFLMVKSNLHRRYFTKRNVYISIAASWILAANFPLSYALQGNGFMFHPGKGICIFDVEKLNLIHAFLTGFLNIQFPYIIMSFCYFKIYQKVKLHNAQLRRPETGVASGNRISARDIRITKILFAIVLAYTICWAPFYVIDLIGLFCGQFFAPRLVYVFYSIVVGSTAAVSPILYGALNRELRVEIIKLLKTLHCSLFRRATVRIHVTELNMK